MRHTPIAAVMVHVASLAEALAWYERAFPHARRQRVSHPAFEFLVVGDVQLEFVLADHKVSAGAAGTVVYWAVPEFEAALAHFQRIGARLYRGPMQIEGGQAMCQVQDPWGNCIGLRGPASCDADAPLTPLRAA
ncbi:VOC family protein [Sphaerotilaceae bacterium SBD11-9]